ncbi:TRAP transporter small permease subunit [Microbulbifer sp. 2201CG32-9]|uniref:TRAP transporter small permease subunit n=1 Tax=Microbulbifer sp. 2201CG32-9 TaxID=3232309 RepID=UPI00345C40CC
MRQSPISPLLRWTHRLDWLADATGFVLGWFTLAMVLLQSAVVALRYGFNSGSVALQDSVIYLHGVVFLLGLAYALRTGAHVRVDVFYRRMGERGRAWVDAVGTLVFLLPLCAFILVGGWQFAAASWAVHEASASADGLGGVYLLKSLLPLAAATLALQGLAQLGRAINTLVQLELQQAPQRRSPSPAATQVEEAGV